MNLRQIQELIKFVAKSGATEVDLEIGDVKLSIKSPPKGKVQNNDQPIAPTQIIPLQQPDYTSSRFSTTYFSNPTTCYFKLCK